MRGTVAKKLRKQAVRRTIGLPVVAYERSSPAKVSVKSTRGLYLMFKTQWRKGLIAL